MYSWKNHLKLKFGVAAGYSDVRIYAQGTLLTTEEKQVVLASLAIKIEEELNELKKERDIIRI
ncbi:hypothetical protein KKA14_03610 [bacterium]|nr:hypothetical protein [bacterium]